MGAPSAHAGDIPSPCIDTALRQHPCIHLFRLYHGTECGYVGDHVSKGNDFIVVNDLADGLSIRFSDLAKTDLAEKLLGIVETPRLPETP
ncbi:hypothetical protein [Eikenella sp. NML03-A-027]|uniref:hypothetical protein n=1 Tax=Eikenella sp. NML03-A-027 TaxID=1795828 RepID=UPI000AE61557|nr:hypothetical protein [Eikenella sp. NML03-A-027]